MDQLLVAIALDPLHQGGDLLLLDDHQLLVLALNLAVDLLLMLLNLRYLERVCLISELVCLVVLFKSEALAL